MRAVNDRSVDDIIAQVKQIVGDMPVYLTFDIDCLDPAFAPGTGTPVIGGLTSDRAIKLVRGLKDLNIVGMDVVEVAPAYDQSKSPPWRRRLWRWRCYTFRQRRRRLSLSRHTSSCMCVGFPRSPQSLT